MAVITMRQMLEAGAHFGHQTRRWNPKMKRFIFGERNGIYIIDLQQTLARIETAYSFVRDLVADGGSVLFVGTKRQAQEAVAEEGRRCGQFYVTHRWLGGTLTNFVTVRASMSSRRSTDARMVTKLVSVPPSQRWVTKYWPQRRASSATASCAWRLVPTKSSVRPSRPICSTKSHACRTNFTVFCRSRM